MVLQGWFVGCDFLHTLPLKMQLGIVQIAGVIVKIRV
jgi:hypothetical protein